MKDETTDPAQMMHEALLRAIEANPGQREYRVILPTPDPSKRDCGGAVRMRLGVALESATIDRSQGQSNREAAAREGDEAAEVVDGDYVVAGTTSSTSVDWYGTEMSVVALDDMGVQMAGGVSLFPRHGGWLDVVNWDEELGITLQGTVRRGDVANPADPSEDGYLLDIQALVYGDASLAKPLADRIKRGRPIGLSIGGWFLEVRYLMDDEGEIDRIIIERVLLDHTAVVRNPANPDSNNLQILRSACEAVPLGLRSRPRPTTRQAAPAGAGAFARVADDYPAQVPTDVASGSTDTASNTEGDSPAERSTDMADQDLTAVFAKLDAIADEQRKINDRLATVEATREATPKVEAAEGRAAEATLDHTEIATSIATAIREALAANKPDPKPEPEAAARGTGDLEAEVERLKARLDNRDRAIETLVGGGRIGRGVSMAVPTLPEQSDDFARAIKALADEAGAQDNAPTLRATVLRNVERLSGFQRDGNGLPPRGGEAARNHQRAIQDAPRILRSLCMAAEADGLIGNLDAGWN